MMSWRSDVSYIYIIQGGTGLLKIGMSRHPKKRLKELQANNTSRLVLLDVTSVAEAEARQIERRAHALLAEHRVRGEWFAVTIREARSAIKTAAAAEIDLPVHTLSYRLTADQYARLSRFVSLKAGRTQQSVGVAALEGFLAKYGQPRQTP